MARMLRLPAKVSKKVLLFAAASLLMGAGLFAYRPASAALIDPRSLKISNPAASATNVTYQFEVGVISAGTLGSVRIQFCNNTSLIGDPCTPPAGFDASAAVLAAETGETGFSIHSSSTAYETILTRTPAGANTGLATFTLEGMTNPSNLETVFVRVLTYASDDATGPYTDAGGLAFATNADVNFSAEVPPFLLFCAGVSIDGFNCATAEGDLIDFGTFEPAITSAGVSQMLAATNADGGYGIRVSGTTLASGNNIIEPMTGQFSNTGNSQFGMNLKANVQPNVGRDVEGPGTGQPTAGYDLANRYRFASGEVVATSNNPDDWRKYTVSYVVNVPEGQPGGVYAATMTYICLANF